MIIFTDFLFPAFVFVQPFVSCLTCSIGYFLNKKEDCIACPEHCSDCNSTEYCFLCKNGYWGKICESQCSSCMAGSRCGKTNGFCKEECRYGYSGDLCNIRCDTKCLYCNRQDSYSCVQCVPGRYPSASCNETCSGCHEQNCDEVGVCLLGCVDGFWGRQRCERKCPLNCKYASCDRDNGTCIFGCKDEIIGLHCNGTRNDSSVNDTNSTLVFPVVVIVIVTVLVLVGALLALVFLRRKCTRQKNREDSVTEEAASLVDQVKQRTTKPVDERKTDDVNARETTNKYKNKRMTTNASDSKLQPKTGRQQLQEFVDRVRTLSDEDYRRYFLRLTVSMSRIEISVNKENNPDNFVVDESVLFKDTITVEIGNTKKEFKNARFIQGKECNTPEYIAYEGPTGQKSDISRFWRMIWELDCKCIVMLDTLIEVEKEIQQYWPNKGDCVSYGRLFLRRRGENAHESVQREQYVTRKIEIKEGTQVMGVTQLHFKGPPEKIFEDLFEFREEVKKAKSGRGPTVVHGRADQTGTFIALDMLLNEVDDMVDCVDAKELDIFACVDNLRRQGMSVVENEEQYKCLYQVVSHYIEEKLGYKDENECGGWNTDA